MLRLTALLFIVTTLCQGQIRLSERAEISVLTCGPWQGELYTAFGHSAFRIFDPLNGINDVYNYGVFDFNRPNFYLNFARGNNIYQLGVFDYRSFEYSYIYHNRYIHEQVLNLSADEKQRLFEFLQWNALPENQEYLYDYFYDNCATKIPEVMLEVFGDSVEFDGSYIDTDYSFRELTDLYLDEQPWGDLGIDIGLGLPTDKKATPYQYMFLPEFVESGFAHAYIYHDGIKEPLVRETNIIYESQPEESAAGPFHPLLVFILFLLVTSLISLRDIRRARLSQGFDILLFGITGLLGMLLVILWLGTNHQAAAKNLNLLWALPTHLLVIPALLRRKRWLRTYFIAVAVLMILLLAIWFFLPQKLHYSLIPFVAAVAVRAYTRYRVKRPGR